MRTPHRTTYPHPVWPLCAETQALEAEADAGLARAVLVGLLVTFLQAVVLVIGGGNDDKGGVCAVGDAVDVPFGEFCRCSSPTLL